MASIALDYSTLFTCVDHLRVKRSMSWRQLAAELDLPPGTFTRLNTGKGMSVNTFVTLLNWLGMDESIRPFLLRTGHEPEPEETHEPVE